MFSLTEKNVLFILSTDWKSKKRNCASEIICNDHIQNTLDAAGVKSSNPVIPFSKRYKNMQSKWEPVQRMKKLYLPCSSSLVQEQQYWHIKKAFDKSEEQSCNPPEQTDETRTAGERDSIPVLQALSQVHKLLLKEIPNRQSYNHSRTFMAQWQSQRTTRRTPPAPSRSRHNQHISNTIQLISLWKLSCSPFQTVDWL